MNPQKTSAGSVAAAVTGMAGVALPFVPPQYQWIAQMVIAALGAFATYHP